MHFNNAIDACAHEVLPTIELTANKPWISQRTLRYIHERNMCRKNSNIEGEKHLKKLIKHSVKQDRTSWLQSLLATGSWQEIRKLRKPAQNQQGRIKNNEGVIMDSQHRAEIMAQHLESVQWGIRPNTFLTDRPALFDQLPMNEDAISEQEVIEVLRKLHKGKAPGHDGLKPEFWKVCIHSEKITSWITALCNQFFHNKSCPE